MQKTPDTTARAAMDVSELKNYFKERFKENNFFFLFFFLYDIDF